MNKDEILQLLEPITDGGIRSVNFFNGRLLTGKDFSREQDARREADKRIGLALGDGVAFGLEIELNKEFSKTNIPVVTVKPGLAINREGQTLRLANNVKVALSRTRSVETIGIDCLFKNCQPLIGGTYVAGAGVYVLTIAPLEWKEGHAATNGLDASNVRCNTDATVEAVQFRLLAVNNSFYAGLDVSSTSFRNELAYRCFGAGIQPDWFADLLGADSRQDNLPESLCKPALSPQEVPLGLLFFTGAADLQFIDLWAVRRPLSRISDLFPSLVDGRRIAVGQAMLQQFQAQIESLRTTIGSLGAVTAQSHFRYLPPMGIIPVAEETDATDAQATRFFAGMTYRSPVYINSARVESLIRDSLCYPPIDTQTIDPITKEKDLQKGEMVWLYRVRENRMAIDFPNGGQKPQSYLIFASGHLPYIGDAQFDLGHYNYANYALAR
ncbi:MAG: hypothetical protein ACXWT4_00540 [Methylobacter sp.]